MIKRVVSFSNPVYLSMKNGQLTARKPDECGEFASIPIEDLGVVILDNNRITISHGLMVALINNNVAVVTCNSSHMPIGLHMPLEGNTLQSERFSQQQAASLPLKKQLWQQTVQCKINNQAKLLSELRGIETGNMRAWSRSVRSGDPDNMEARAAVYYWGNIFPEIEGFRRRPDGETPNQLLNYSYAVIRAVTARALVGAGLLPTFGIHHRNRYNAYCLADDIMEPYRPYADAIVAGMVKEFGGDLGSISLRDRNIKQRVLSLPVADVKIDGKTRPLMNAMEATAVRLSACFAGKRRKILYPEFGV